MGDGTLQRCAVAALQLGNDPEPVLVAVHTATLQNADTGERKVGLLLSVFRPPNVNQNLPLLTIRPAEVEVLIEQLRSVAEMVKRGEIMPVLEGGTVQVHRAARRRKSKVRPS